jgi:hypothetical protein
LLELKFTPPHILKNSSDELNQLTGFNRAVHTCLLLATLWTTTADLVELRKVLGSHVSGLHSLASKQPPVDGCLGS